MTSFLSRLRPLASRVAYTATVALLLAGCGDVARMLAPGRAEVAPAHISVRTSIAAQIGTANDVVALRVRSSYVRADGSRVAMAQQTIALTSAQVQSVPIPVEVASCLADATRDSASEGGCPVVLELALVVNDVVVDQQVIGPLRLTPGATTSVADPVTLFEITSLTLSRRGSGALDPELSLAIGGSLELAASLRDSRGQPVTDRTIAWSSASPTVATVDANGLVRAVSPGTARITATASGLSASQSVVVQRPPVELVIAATAASGRGRVRSTPTGIDCVLREGTATGSCRSQFAADAFVTLTAVADSANRLDGWSDACDGVAASCTVRMTGALRASARFTALRRIRIAAPTTDGQGTITSEPAGIACQVDGATLSGSCEMEVPVAATVRLRASPTPSSTSAPPTAFGGWSGACTGALADCSVVVGATDVQLRPSFLGPRTVTVVRTGAGSGRVTGNGIACVSSGDTCTLSVMHGAQIALNATPNSDATFEGWSGCSSAQGTSCALTVTNNVTLTARFAERPVTLTVTLTGSGAGELSVDGRTRCALAAGQRLATCAVDLPRGSVVTITAVAAQYSRLVAFRDACSGTALCSLTMSGARTVSAEFTRELVPIRLVVQGTGGGSVQLVGATTCTHIKDTPPAQCEALVPADQPRILRASADDGSEFKGFSLPCDRAPSCTFVPNEPATIVAVFDEQLITVDLAPVLGANGRGVVISTIGPNINCSYAVGGAVTGICTLQAPVGTLVVLRATPDVIFGSTFGAWTGICDGVTTTTCTFVLRSTTPATMGARFIARP
jgi:trimeric autotransporter adhesin